MRSFIKALPLLVLALVALSAGYSINAQFVAPHERKSDTDSITYYRKVIAGYYKRTMDSLGQDADYEAALEKWQHLTKLSAMVMDLLLYSGT